MEIKVRCTKCKTEEHLFTVGREYLWVDNKLKNDRGHVYTSYVSGIDPKKWRLSEFYDFEIVKGSACKFKVGDRVRAHEKTPYYITTNGWEGTVTRVLDDNRIEVRGYVESYGREREYDVSAKYFDLVSHGDISSWKLIIEGSGNKTTAKYIVGRNTDKVATVYRCREDKHSVFDAVTALMKKMGFKSENTPEEDAPITVKAPLPVGTVVTTTKKIAGIPKGAKGRICCYKDRCYIVDFCVPYRGTHNCNGVVPSGCGYWILPHDFIVD